ncbi:hypothetical protein CXB51_003308 [Gossypium anomalum]|uniref:Uncharacterized protein n=1 Tax=Gossypium anomalum TaxID=47600 RepID=A0A8J5ZIN3_9ROSI|nr:hypothetical protein CXB51_003308 [Gossypium anomalum]
MLLFGSPFLHSTVLLKAFLFPQTRNRDSALKAWNGHSDHRRIEMKKILPKISFRLSLQMRSKLLLFITTIHFQLQLNSQISVFGGDDVSFSLTGNPRTRIELQGVNLFQIWRYGATDENLLRNIHYSTRGSKGARSSASGQYRRLLQDIFLRHESVQCLVSIIKSMGAWMDQELKIGDSDLSRSFESDTSSERPSTSIVEDGVVPDCELHPELNFELSDTATLEQCRAYKIELQVGNFFMLG